MPLNSADHSERLDWARPAFVGPWLERDCAMFELRTTAATFSRGTSYKATFVLLGLMDLALTLYALENGFVERNPVFASLQHNPLGLLLLKFVGPVFIAWLVPARLLLPSIAFLFAVLGWNVGELVG